MKKYIVGLLLLGSIFAISCQQKSTEKGNLTLTGKVEGLKQGTLYIQKIQDTLLTTLDSIVVKGNSEFSRSLQIDSPEVHYLTLNRGTSSSLDNQLMFFAEPGKIHIETSLKSFYSDAKISGSKNQEIYQDYLKTRSAITDKQNEVLVEILNADRNGKATEKDSLVALSKKLQARRYLNAVNFALNHKDSDVAPYIALTEIYDRQIKYLDTIQNSLSKEVATNYYGKQLKAFIEDRKEAEKEPTEEP